MPQWRIAGEAGKSRLALLLMHIIMYVLGTLSVVSVTLSLSTYADEWEMVGLLCVAWR
jgi:hypothetical protein